MDDKITLDNHKVFGWSLSITYDIFYLTPFLMNWFVRDLVMDDHHGRMEFDSAHHQNWNLKIDLSDLKEIEEQSSISLLTHHNPLV